MKHPEELLAGYVDGTLSSSERAAVDTHLSACGRCGRELALAAAARLSLASLVDVSPPSGVAARALEEAGAVKGSAAARLRAAKSPRWYRAAGVAAAAAVIALAVVVALPDPKSANLERNAAGAADETGRAGAGLAAPASAGIEIQDVNYQPSSLQSLTGPYTDTLAAAETADGRLGSQREAQRALECLTTAAPEAGGDLQRLIQARFQSAPAYLAVFLEGPGAGQPIDKVAIWVVSKSDCSILAFTQAKI
jgi:putative zinc finger protein